jgi:8-oxo-dGTP pyrophosphatase MutT (NUDIX family)
LSPIVAAITMKSVQFPERLRRCLRERSPATLRATSSIACAVLVPVVALGDDYGVVYTLRSEHLPNHKGQVAFPGGKHSAARDRDLLQTALREAHEEIGIVPADVEVLGRLDDVYTMAADYVITPYVGLLPPGCSYRADPGEVADIFSVRVADLADAEHHTTEMREWQGASYPIEVITAGRHKIWGATHRITIDLLERLGAAPGSR